MSDKVLIYTDGGADPNPGLGGWAAILQFGEHERVLAGNERDTTNNRMELTAAIKALQALTRPCQVVLYTDSEYLRRGITEWIDKWAARDWRHKNGRPVPNADLWQTLWPLTRRHQIEWRWVRGHTGDPLNERVDELARQARLELAPPVEIAGDIPRLYVRASCRGNPGPGGWGVVLEWGPQETEQQSGSDPQTTNNRMELIGVIEGLRLLPEGGAVQLYTTSDYVFQGATQWIHGWRRRGWRKKNGDPISNADLWQALDRLSRRYQIRWINAKGQEDEPSPGLEEAAQLAAAAAQLSST